MILAGRVLCGAIPEEGQMPRGSPVRKPARPLTMPDDSRAQGALRTVLWRLARLERQVQTLSELVRDHAEDADRLVKIVGEDHEVLRQQLLREHKARLRQRKRTQIYG